MKCERRPLLQLFFVQVFGIFYCYWVFWFGLRIENFYFLVHSLYFISILRKYEGLPPFLVMGSSIIQTDIAKWEKNRHEQYPTSNTVPIYLNIIITEWFHNCFTLSPARSCRNTFLKVLKRLPDQSSYPLNCMHLLTGVHVKCSLARFLFLWLFSCA